MADVYDALMSEVKCLRCVSETVSWSDSRSAGFPSWRGTPYVCLWQLRMFVLVMMLVFADWVSCKQSVLAVLVYYSWRGEKGGSRIAAG